MSVFRTLAKVRKSTARMEIARTELARSSGVLLDRGMEYPLTTLSGFAGLGAVAGALKLHPFHLPAMSGLIGTGLSELAIHGVRLMSEIGLGNGAPAGR